MNKLRMEELRRLHGAASHGPLGVPDPLPVRYVWLEHVPDAFGVVDRSRDVLGDAVAAFVRREDRDFYLAAHVALPKALREVQDLLEILNKAENGRSAAEAERDELRAENEKIAGDMAALLLEREEAAAERNRLREAVERVISMLWTTLAGEP